MAFVLAYELKRMCELHGVENCGFLTLTFGDKTPPRLREVQRRFNSLATHVLRGRYTRAIFVVERGETKGRLHFHGVVVVGKDIRTGVDFEGIERQDYRSANAALRGEWSFWRSTAPRYKFGRTELLPVKSTAEGIARYVGSYIKKQIMHRIEEDKGARLIRFMNYGLGDRRASSRFAWNSDGAWVWRQKVEAWAKRFAFHSFERIAEECGPRWAWHFKEEILAEQIVPGRIAPSERAAVMASSTHTDAMFRALEAERQYEKDRGENVQRVCLVGKREFEAETPAQEKRRLLKEVAAEFESAWLLESHSADRMPWGSIVCTDEELRRDLAAAAAKAEGIYGRKKSDTDVDTECDLVGGL